MVQLGSQSISRLGLRPYVIAEAGVNHENDLALAHRLIEMAKSGGADAIKFQTYKAGKLASKHSPAYWDTSKEPTTSQYELFKKYDGFSPDDYRALAAHCRKVGIDFMSTPFDLEAVDFLNPLLQAYKIASADLTNVPLLRKVAGTGKPAIISTGAATWTEIESAVQELHRGGTADVVLLHCVLNYPTPDEKAHLMRVKRLLELFPEQVIGYSDHTLPGDACLPVLVAYALGARVIEKHFTHDKSLPGNDHYHAMDEGDLRKLTSSLRNIASMMGTADEAKFIADQGPAIQHARRSIVTQGRLAKGTVLDASRLTVKRPASGISPIHWDQILGKKLLVDLDDDTPLQWHHVSN
jgi:N-acetylneuraminate synthase